jgi:hypothetical protein
MIATPPAQRKRCNHERFPNLSPRTRRRRSPRSSQTRLIATPPRLRCHAVQISPHLQRIRLRRRRSPRLVPRNMVSSPPHRPLPPLRLRRPRPRTLAFALFLLLLFCLSFRAQPRNLLSPVLALHLMPTRHDLTHNPRQPFAQDYSPLPLEVSWLRSPAGLEKE